MASGGELRGADDMRRRLRLIAEKYPHVVGGGLLQETEIEATECKKRCPVYVGPPGPGKPIPGLLRSSIHTEGPFYDGRIVYTLISAGGAAGAYAWVQHEHTEFFHQVGQAKYIESTILESRPFMAQRVARRIGFDLVA